MKKHLPLLMILLFFQQLLAFDIWVKPQINYNINQDENLQKYYTAKGVISSGISLDIMHKNIGIFAELNHLDFTAQEVFSSKIYKDKIKSNWSSVGLLTRFEFDEIPVIAKIKVGVTYHNNNYSNFFEENYYRGIFLGSEIGYRINKNLQAGLFVNYNNTTFKIPLYVNCTVSRHNYYLSGRQVIDPRFTLGANLAVKIW